MNSTIHYGLKPIVFLCYNYGINKMLGKWKEQIGKTICVNPGREYGKFSAVIFDENMNLEFMWYNMKADPNRITYPL